MRKKETPPKIAEVVRIWMPEAREEELIDATLNFREYLGVVYRIFNRIEDEKHQADLRDRTEIRDIVDNNPNEI